MLPKILLLLLGFAVLSGVIEAQSWIKKIQSSQYVEREEIPGHEEAIFQVGWHYKKLDLFDLFLGSFAAPDVNLTLVGWQRILNDDGSVKEVETVQLVIPPKPANVPDQSDEEEDDNEDEDKEDPINEARKTFKALAQSGIAASVTAEKFTRNGEEEELRYAAKDEIYTKAKRFAIYNKTVFVKQQELDNIVENLKPTLLGSPTVLRYDGGGKLISDKSNIQPFLLGTIIDSYEAPENVILAAPEIVAKISQQYPQEEIPKQLGIEFNNVFSDYRWRVLVNPKYYFITRDVDVTLTYDNFNLDERSDDKYLVYGVKKSTK